LLTSGRFSILNAVTLLLFWSTVTAPFKVPERCKLCGATGTVIPETTISLGVVLLKWCCRSCRGEWPITSDDEESHEESREEDWPTPHRAQ
jgi:hypothetical protein